MDYRSVIESKYRRESWLELLHDIFRSGANFRTTPITVNANSPLAVSSLQLGTITLADDNKIAVYEIKLSDSVDIIANRVGIRNLLHNDWRAKGCVGAFMFCYRENESVLRFSYVSSTFKFNEAGQLERDETDTKRFTYLLGAGHRSRTAIKQFEDLKSSSLLLADITKAFSIEALGDRFFKDYKKIYEDIIEFVTGKRFIKVSNKWEEKVVNAPNSEIMGEFSRFSNPEKAVRDYVKNLMGRIVFLQFIQKKGWLGVPANKEWGEGDKEFLQNLYDRSNKENFIDDVLETLFNDINKKRGNDIANSILGENIKVPYLNGGLFQRDKADECAFKLPKKFLDEMFKFFSSYNFTIDENDPEDAEIGVDPEMLGRIFENLLEDNKDKGAFYTPKEIVQYMCRESLIGYLQTNKDQDEKRAIRSFVLTYNTANLSETLKSEIDQKLKGVKICDPAIGSGAFPMGLLKELYACRSVLEGLEKDKAAEIKKHIIQNSIYGVDIEKGAVDIARLRFWLSIIVDEKTPHALPNMDFKIMQGNSLIPTFGGKYVNLTDKLRHVNSSKIRNSKKKLFELQQEFYNAEGEQKLELLIQIKFLILEIVKLQMDYEYNKEVEDSARTMDLFNPQPLAEIRVDESKRSVVATCIKYQRELLSTSKSLEEKATISIPFFDWKIMFSDVFSGDNNGFDIVIGNPPYIKEGRISKDFFKQYKDSPYYKGKMDIWYMFACYGIDLLNSNGLICFIATNNWGTSFGASKLRDKVVTETRICHLVDFGAAMMFENASIQTMIMMFQKDRETDNYKFDYRKLTSSTTTEREAISILDKTLKDAEYFYPTVKRDDLNNKTITFSQNEGILEKIYNNEYNIFLEENEITNGIHPHYDFINKKLSEKYGFAIGAGIFGIENAELPSLALTENELRLIKPYYKSSENIIKYTVGTTDLSIIYTTSSYKDPHSMDTYPHIKARLDRYSEVITSDNKPYGLHRARVESFFIGEKIVVVRKSAGKPIFAYADGENYMSATFYVIKTSKVCMKYLTGLLNSKLIEFWLKNKGKMQGTNYQLDKEPLQQIPIVAASTEIQNKIAGVVDNIIINKTSDLNADISQYVNEIDSLIYKLYKLSDAEIQTIENSLRELD